MPLAPGVSSKPNRKSARQTTIFAMMRGANPRPNIAQQGTGAVALPEAPIDSAAPKFVIVPFQMIGATKRE
ncbi:hypothetical protein [Hyphomonas sp. UBA4494]|uniref:hypothetical protein n=1 Tax=Hyphomonas sp. UBA4494 TaxID=1946631 RepID=UPI0025BEE904|nr:hypothetical protein [Hyphomonas sp. UBA4494]MBR9806700.1 hypothetical protein [Alphaproteobacteria bacterium]